MSYLTRILAEHVRAAPTEYCPAIADVARRCILDLLGAAIAGLAMPSAVAARTMAAPVFGSGEAPIWCAGRCAPAGALFCNVTAASALDIDDGNRAARGHPGACVIPAALLIAGQTGATGRELISAIICGYDVGARIAASQTTDGIRTRQSGRWAAFASAATAGRLLQLEPVRLSHALAISGVMAPNQLANGSSGYSRLTGNDVKEGIAWSSLLGITAAHLAAAGFTGPEDLLDHPDYYDGSRILGGLGRHWEIADTYFKPYACCRYIHPALDAYSELAADTIGPDDIIEVEVQTFAWALKLANKVSPESLVDMQYSLPFCMAILAVDGVQALAPIDKAALGRTDLIRFAQKVRLSVDPDLDRFFPAQTLSRVVIRTRTLELTSDIHTPLGDKTRPMGWEAICRKFRNLTRHQLQDAEQQDIIGAVAALPGGGAAAIADLLQALRRTC
ncbi:MmgE/PrpD family protein [Rhizobium sp. 1399]|uniref:MmgE/PrpD family protein n=1 Tax=Rhizobium sp. 1399 TaxID=2817758 RepID=UPI0028656C1A|nr:MmgE/PrpD family protein [Rhizobium sp. 1399]MDR6667852.1 2-methylcitrate dehydratase PrpD [Rhizobium sp. 1399]